MRLKITLLFLPTITALLMFGNNSYSQALYSYRDENGIQVFTNIPPVNQMRDFKINGAMSSPTLPDPKLKFESYDSIIEKYAGDYRLDPSLIRSIIATESGFNPKAVSPKGARGLMQLMPATAKRLGVQDCFDPEQNIRGGVEHFRSLMDIFDNNLVLSLAAYNAGENLVQRLGRVPEIKETRDYVQSVTKLYGKNELSPREDSKYPMFRFFDESGVLHLTNIPPLH
jgi:hypothetical protein